MKINTLMLGWREVGWTVVLLLANLVLASSVQAQQVLSMSMGTTTSVRSATPFDVSFQLLGTTGVSYTVDFSLVHNNGTNSLLYSQSYTPGTGKHMSITLAYPFRGEPTGWRIRGKVRNQASNLVVSETDNFTVLQSSPAINFIGVVGSENSDRLIMAKSATANADASSFTMGETLYFAFRLKNAGEATQLGAKVRVLWDGVSLYGDLDLTQLIGTVLGVTTFDPLQASMSLNTPGNHTLEVQVIGGSNYPVNQSLSQSIFVASTIDLRPYTPPSWNDSIAVTSSSTSTAGALTYSSTTPLFVSLAWVSSGTGNAGAFRVRLLIDNVVHSTRQFSGLDSNFYDVTTGISIGTLAPGSHTVQMDVDSAGEVIESNEANNSYSINLLITSPQIAVELPSGTVLVDGVSTLAFSPAVLDSSSTLNLKIRNTGNEALIVGAGGLSFTGANAADFSAVSWSGSTVPASGNVTLQLRFAPAAVGTRTARLAIASNAPGSAASFELNLTGEGRSRQAGWRETHFPGSTAGSGPGADLATPMGDDLTNIEKFAFGLNPAVPGVEPVTLASSGPGGSSTLVYPLSKAALADGCSFVVEWSDSPQGPAWSSAGVATSTSDPGGATLQITATVPNGDGSSRFFRLRLVQPGS